MKDMETGNVDGLFKEKTEEFNNSINKLSPVGVNA